MKNIIFCLALFSLSACAGYTWNSTNPDFRPSEGLSNEPGSYEPQSLPPK